MRTNFREFLKGSVKYNFVDLLLSWSFFMISLIFIKKFFWYRFHELQDRITPVAYVMYSDTDTCPEDCQYSNKQRHYHCIWVMHRLSFISIIILSIKEMCFDLLSWKEQGWFHFELIVSFCSLAAHMLYPMKAQHLGDLNTIGSMSMHAAQPEKLTSLRQSLLRIRHVKEVDHPSIPEILSPLFRKWNSQSLKC